MTAAARAHLAHLHRLLWQLESGPDHADRRDSLRRRYFASYTAYTEGARS